VQHHLWDSHENFVVHKVAELILAWVCLHIFCSYHIIFGGAVVICFFDSYEDRSSSLTFTFCLYFSHKHKKYGGDVIRTLVLTIKTCDSSQ